MSTSNYLRSLAERLMRVPVMYGTDQGDVDRLSQIARQLENRRKEMPFTRALHVLAAAHTCDDDLVGYNVLSHPDMLVISQSEYAEAWGVVRKALGQPYEPEDDL